MFCNIIFTFIIIKCGEIRMLGRTIKYFRLKNGKNTRELAMATGLSEYVIKNYENGKRLPVLSEIRNIASALNVNMSWLMSSYNHYKYRHGEFRKNSRFSKHSQEYIRISVEDYLDRFLTIADILGSNVMRKVPEEHSILPTGDVESDASKLRDVLGLATTGAISNLIGSLEDKGILVYLLEYKDDKFSGMNGLVCNRPYVVLNSMATPERQRSTLAHELGHIFFSLPEDDNSEWEKYMTAISGAFLFPASDVFYELGNKRQAITADMLIVAKEYGISLQLLAKRANILKIINDDSYRNFNIMLSRHGLRKNEPSQMKMEEPTLFAQYVIRAVSEEKITYSKGAELLRMPYYDFEKKLSINKSAWN